MSLQTSSNLPHLVALSHRRDSKHDDSKHDDSKQRCNSGTDRQPKATRGPNAHSQPKIRVAQGRAGDHLSIHPLLMSLLHGPSEVEFQLNLDRPDYDPSQRLLLWRGDDLIGHIRLTRRLIRLHNAWLPTCDLSEFALLPEFSGDQHRIQLLDAAKQLSLDLGAVLLTSRTHGASVSEDSSWVANGSVWCLGVSPRDLLASCAARLEAHQRTASLQVRPWRYVEQQALADIYESNTRECDGAPLRDDEYWHWLLVRRGYDEILVATVKSDNAETGDEAEVAQEIVGYAFVRGNDIVELMVKPEWPDATLRLVQRIAADAIERDDHRVRIFQPPIENQTTAVVRDLLQSDSKEPAWTKPVQAAYVVDPFAFVESVCLRSSAEIVRRFDDTKLGLKLGHEALIVESQGRGLRVAKQKATRSQVTTSDAQVSALLLGNAFAGDTLPDGLRCSSVPIRELVEQLFQLVTLWRSTLDDLPSSN